MKRCLLIIFSILIGNISLAQISYESPLGFTVSFDETWKRLPKEILKQKLEDVKDLLKYREDIQFDACYQKIGKANMDFPYILFKNVYRTTKESEIIKIKKYIMNRQGISKTLQNVINGKLDFKLKIGHNYYDTKNNILIIIYEMSIANDMNFVGMIAFYFGKKASLIVYCYSNKSEFENCQKEFLNIIYSIKDKGMISTIPNFITKHDIAVKYYNEGRMQSDSGDFQGAIRLYTKAIENYPLEDNYVKSEAYFNRGLNKRYLNDLEGAIADYTEAIKIRRDYYKAYNNRGVAKIQLRDYLGAITDFTMTIKYDNYNTEFTHMAFTNRGFAKLSIGQDGCPDLRKAMELGNKKATTLYYEFCK